MNRTLLSAALAISIQVAFGQSTIAYFTRPVSPYPEFPFFGDTDLNVDGEPDLRFTFGSTICTDDIPTSACWTPYFISAVSSNQITVSGGNTALFPAGTMISSSGATNGAWNAPGGAGYLIGSYWNYDRGSDTYRSRWDGPLTSQPDSFFGIRFHAADGMHYAWVHVRLEGSPLIVDWAYETRPDTRIFAGAKPVVIPLAAPQVVRPSQLRLKWQSEIGRAYQVQMKESLTIPLWTNLDFVVIGTTTNAAVDLSVTGAAKFFRVVEAD